MPNEPEKLVPARYIGLNRIHRNKLQGPGYNIDGTKRNTLMVERGDELMMPEREIIGQTYLFDPHNVNPPFDLGAGKRVKPEHTKLSNDELAAMGYEFHEGRPDFELIVPAAPQPETTTQEAPPEKQTTKGASK